MSDPAPRSSVDPLVVALENGHSDHGLTRGWRAMIATALLIGALSFVVSAALFASNRHLANDNCLRLHKVVSTLDQILINGRASALRYERDGTITRVQLERALRENDVARSKLYRADCPPGSAPPLK